MTLTLKELIQIRSALTDKMVNISFKDYDAFLSDKEGKQEEEDDKKLSAYLEKIVVKISPRIQELEQKARVKKLDRKPRL